MSSLDAAPMLCGVLNGLAVSARKRYLTRVLAALFGAMGILWTFALGMPTWIGNLVFPGYGEMSAGGSFATVILPLFHWFGALAARLPAGLVSSVQGKRATPA